MRGNEPLIPALDGGGSCAADTLQSLFRRLYGELHCVAKMCLARRQCGKTLEATALVHDAYLKFTRSTQLHWQTEAHFFNAAGEAMRHVLLDHSRRESAEKRGGNRGRIDLDQIDVAGQVDDTVDLESLDQALCKLQRFDPRAYRVVIYRYFSNMSEKQVAGLLGVTVRTVQRDWQSARGFLFAELNDGATLPETSD